MRSEFATCVLCSPQLKWPLLFILDPTKADDAFYSRDREIEEIVALLPEIREKIQDTRDMEAESLKKIGDKMSVEESLAKANGADGSSANLLFRGFSFRKQLKKFVISLVGRLELNNYSARGA